MLRMKAKQKSIAVIALTIILVCSALPLHALARAQSPFVDLNPSHPYYDAVLYCYEKGIFSGTTENTFEPDTPLTRAMFVSIMGRAAEFAGLEIRPAATNNFMDLEPESYYERYVSWASRKEIVAGITSTTFEPHTSVTREQMSGLVVRFAQATHLNLGSDGVGSFSDTEQISPWLRTEMETAIASGLVVSSDGSLLPQQLATRGEAAYVLYMLSDKYLPESFALIDFSNVYAQIYPGLDTNQYDKTGFITQNGLKQYEEKGLTSVAGIDVSVYQGDIDWAKVKDAGIEFAIIRVGGRGYGQEGNFYDDDNFDKNVQGALENGIAVGVYFFSQAITEAEAREEAAYTLGKIKGYDIQYPVVFDWEIIEAAARTDGIDNALLTNCAVAFCEAIADAGYTPVIYANQQVAYTKYELDRLQKYDFWLAEYNEVPGFYYDFQMWQYTSNGSLDGINGSVDLNLSFIRYEDR